MEIIKIKNLIEEKPEILPNLLELISDNLKTYKRDVHSQRDKNAYEAFNNIIPLLKPDVMCLEYIPYLIDMIYYLCPSYNVYQNASPLAKKLFKDFMNLIDNTNYIENNESWLRIKFLYNWLDDCKRWLED